MVIADITRTSAKESTELLGHITKGAWASTTSNHIQQKGIPSLDNKHKTQITLHGLQQH